MKIENTGDIRDFLIDQMIAVADGKQAPSEAKAICNYAQQIYNTINLEVRYGLAVSKHSGKHFSPIKFQKSKKQ